ncbi:MAG TPA: CocE/NonD family hydrolase [Gemmatimonadales bacterium]|nr:CocE/NonD family hydrolase [Gemmatimonadales bacterium]
MTPIQQTVTLPELNPQLQNALADRYLLERELGRGGTATVYLARDLEHGRLVALKVLHTELGATLGPDRFLREIRLAARLQHPNILSVYDSGGVRSGTDGTERLWFTMPFVSGESLRDRLRREGQLPVADAIRITREASQGLRHAHEHGVVHRDIKPENLLLAEDGSTLVADFGLARALADDERLTAGGMAMGTPAYMSPEQASGASDVDARSDVYSLGCVLYEMLAGEPPFTGPTAQATIARRFAGPAPRVSVLRPSVPTAVVDAVDRALAMTPADRFTTVTDFARALEAGHAPASSAATSPRSGRRRSLAWLILGAAILVALALGYAALAHAMSASRQPPGDRGAAPNDGSQQDSTLVLRGGRWLDVRAGRLRPNGAIVVQRGKIVGMHPPGSRWRQPDDVRVFFMDGRTVLPGLIDSHVHLTLAGNPDSNARATLAAGFTTVADLGSAGGAGARLRDSIATGIVPGPRVVAAGSWIGAKGGVCEFGGATVSGASEARSRALSDIGSGADLLKVCVTGWPQDAVAHPDSVELTAAPLAAVMQAATAAHRPVFAHAIGRAGALLAASRGVRALAHTPIVDSAAAVALKRSGIRIISTLATLGRGPGGEAVRRSFGQLRAAGVPIVMGTDAGVLPHGKNAQELVALTDAGLSPAEALRAATIDGAALLGLGDAGEIRVGAVADLVVVAGDPLRDIRVIERPVAVVKGGRIVPAPFPGRVDSAVAVPMRDSVVLRADVYRPTGDGKFPTLVYRTPYSRADTAGASDLIREAVGRGYAVVRQDVRGRFDSEGVFDAYAQEGKDGFDTIEWAARQPWSTGAVGTFGLSYPGAVQWLAAVEHPPSLKAMVPAMTYATPENFWYSGGVWDGSWLDWTWLNIAPDLRRRLGVAGPRDENAAAEAWRREGAAARRHRPMLTLPQLRGVTPWYYEWMRHPPKDPWWRWATLEGRYDSVGAAVLNLSGWYDEMYGPSGAVGNYMGLVAAGRAAGRAHLILGPWTHGVGSVGWPRAGERDFGGDAALDYTTTVLGWMDRHLKSVDSAPRGPAVRVFVMGSNRWRVADRWPMPGTRPDTLFLGGPATGTGNGRLTRRPATARPAETLIRSDPAHPVRDPFEGRAGAHDYRRLVKGSELAIFETAPFPAPLEIIGQVVAELAMSASVPDFDVWVQLYDVSPDGTAWNLSSPGTALQRASYREGGPERHLVAKGETVRLRLDRMFTANRFLAGHRLRIVITPSFAPLFSVNPQTGAQEFDSDSVRSGVLRLHHSPARISRLILPVVPSAP